MNTTIKLTTTALLALFIASGCGEKPCDGISPTTDVKRLDVLLEGGKLCKDDRGVASIDYPGKDTAAVKGLYEKHLTGAGWTADTAVEGDKLPIVVFSKGKDKMMITFGKSSERRVTFAMVKHCQPAGTPMGDHCIKSIEGLATELKKRN